jgi:uncharacterized protein YdeI (YjbR/CyaY-like superfamily)
MIKPTSPSVTSLTLKIQTLADLRSWLESNCLTATTTWLIFPKKTAGVDFAWSEIVDMLLCYGWIDSVARKVDDKYTSLRISPRNPKSNWSKINKDKISKLEAIGLMHPNGQKMVELAKKIGTWNTLDDVENLVLAADLEDYLKTKSFLEKWNDKGRSFKRGFLEQMLNSKLPQTRLKKMQNLDL